MREKLCSWEGLTNTVYNIRNIIFNAHTSGCVCHADCKKKELGQRCVSIKAAAGNHPETVLAEASATLGEGIKTLSTQKVATAHTKASSKINSDCGVAILTTRNTMKEGTQGIDLHARGTACLSALTQSVEKLNASKDVIEGLFGNDPNALMAMPIFM